MVRKLILASTILIISHGSAAELDDQTRIQVEALNRLKGMDLEANPGLKEAILKVVEKTRGTPEFVELVRDFQIQGQAPALLEFALQNSTNSVGVEAFRLATSEKPDLAPLLKTTNAPALLRLIGNSGEKPLQPLLQSAISDSSITLEAQKEAVRALAKTADGATFLLDLAKADKLPASLRFTATSELNLVPWPELKERARNILPLPQSNSADPLPPVAELVKRKGNPARGAELFASPTVACNSCHQVNGTGTDFGPNLSEIGTKLGKDALYESILDPTSGISFGYEAWTIELKNGDEAFGLITSETVDTISVKTQAGITTEYKKEEIARRQKMATSIMPSGLHLTMTTLDLIDLVEYLSTLRKE